MSDIDSKADTTSRTSFSTKAIEHVALIEKSVTAIRPSMFENCETLQSAVIPDTLTTIGKQAFSNCVMLEHISIPTSVIEIESRAFQGCSSLISIDVPISSSIRKIGMSSFWRCSSLRSIKIPLNVSKIDVGTFVQCTSLETIDLPSSLVEIGNAAFLCCKELKYIDIPPSVTEIGHGAFTGCLSLRTIDVPSNVTRIRENVFKNCKSLISIIIPSTIKNIEDNAFEGCISLLLINLHPSLKGGRGGDVFRLCDRLKNRCLKGNNYHKDTFTWLMQRFSGLPLHKACYDIKRTESFTALQLSELIAKNNADDLDAMGMTALHIICCNLSASPEMIRVVTKKSTVSFDEMSSCDHKQNQDVRPMKITPTELFLSCRNLDSLLSYTDDMERCLSSLLEILQHGIKSNELECLFSLENQKLSEELCIRDKTTGLYPFMSAASSLGCGLDLVYMLAMKCPELIII